MKRVLVMALALYLSACGSEGNTVIGPIASEAPLASITPAASPTPTSTPDISPEIPNFEQRVVAPGSEVEYTFNVQGIDGEVIISVSGANSLLVIDGFNFQTSAFVSSGQTVTLLGLSSDQFDDLNIIDVTLGDSSFDITFSTESEDASPDSFNFEPVTGLLPGESVEFGPVLVSGINTDVQILVDKGQYSIDGGEFTSSESQVSNGQILHLRAVASETLGATKIVTLTVGDFSTSVAVTTIAETPL